MDHVGKHDLYLLYGLKKGELNMFGWFEKWGVRGRLCGILINGGPTLGSYASH